jgi:hypothetical protein
MKTLRDLLFERHRAAEPKLDQARRRFLARLERVSSPAHPERRGFEHFWHEYVVSLRWHLAGMSAVWAVVLLLVVVRSASSGAPIAKRNLSSRPKVLVVLRQHRTEILELTESVPAAPTALPPRRSEAVPPTAMI